MPDLDIAIIGSGAGGMTAAVALANAGYKVAVFERHYLPGGWCQTFTRGGYRFSPGVHYVGKLQPGGRLRRIYEGLGVSEDLEFCELNTAGFDHVEALDQRFDVPKGRERLADELTRRFPREREGIEGYLRSVERIAAALDGDKRAALSLLRWGLVSAKRHVEAFVSDPFLKAVLLAQSGDHGMMPSRCPAPVHAAVVAHYFDGAYYPRGGAAAIPRAFARALRRRRGQLCLRSGVSRIIIERGRAVGLAFDDGTEVRARWIISNADPETTFGRLIGPELLPRALVRRLTRTRYSTSCLSLFLAVDDDMRARGMDSGNLWHYRDPDVDAIYAEGQTAWDVREPVAGFFLTDTTLKDPSKWQRGKHTLEMFSFISPYAFPKGGPEYERRKAAYGEAMLGALERRFPGIRQKIAFAELGTPATIKKYVNATDGCLYGTEKSLLQVGPFAYRVRTAIPGLWMCGASTLAHGVLGATASGLAAAADIAGVRPDDLLAQHWRPLRVYPSERPDLWPEDVRKTMPRRDERQPA